MGLDTEPGHQPLTQLFWQHIPMLPKNSQHYFQTNLTSRHEPPILQSSTFIPSQRPPKLNLPPGHCSAYNQKCPQSSKQSAHPQSKTAAKHPGASNMHLFPYRRSRGHPYTRSHQTNRLPILPLAYRPAYLKSRRCPHLGHHSNRLLYINRKP
jgi:hypothetical protein